MNDGFSFVILDNTLVWENIIIIIKTNLISMICTGLEQVIWVTIKTSLFNLWYKNIKDFYEALNLHSMIDFLLHKQSKAHQRKSSFPVLEVMKKSKFFNHFPFLLILMIYTLFLNGANSEDYIVGDDDEWNSQGNFLTWSTKYNFSVGDVLGMIFLL